MLFGAWRVTRTPTEIRHRYRTRFAIESSYRHLRQAKIYTCTRDPHLRLVFIAVTLLLRNLWVWMHEPLLAEGRGEGLTLHLERLRFKRLLDWIAGTYFTTAQYLASAAMIEPKWELLSLDIPIEVAARTRSR